MIGSTAFGSNPQWVVRPLLVLFSALMLTFLAAPVLVIVPLSFNSSSFMTYPLAGISLRWYGELFGSTGWLGAFRSSFIVAGAATALATPLGTLAALGMARLPQAFKPLILAVLLAPMFVPVIIVGVATYFLYAPLGLTNSYLGLVLAHTTLAAPFVVLVVHAALQGLDFTLLRAGASLGAQPLIVFFRILLPLIVPGMLAGAIFAFMTSFDEIVVTMFIAGPGQKTLPLKMFEGLREQVNPTITAAATLLIVTSVSLFGVMEWLRRNRERRQGRSACT